jgi:type IV pilus assembly protein PilY1
MKTQLITKNILIILGCLLLTSYVQAANVLLADKPLVDSSTSDVLPNLMFIIDDSGSMDQDYTPDWANSSKAYLYRNSTYNTQYYNPNIVYTPAVKYDGVSMGNQASPWTAVKNEVTETGATKNGTTNLVGNASYYAAVAGEYCKAQDLRDCATLGAPTTTYKFPAAIRWCNTLAEAIAATPAVGNCRAVKEDTFTNLRAPSPAFTITLSTGSPPVGGTVNSIQVAGKEILSGATVGAVDTTSNSARRTEVAAKVAANINACTNGIVASCTIKGYSALASGNVVTVFAPYGIASTTPVIGTTSVALTSDIFTARTPGSLVYVSIAGASSAYPYPGDTVKGDERDDCTGTVCTYTEEMTNYANWHTYYKTRLQGMKSAASLAFKGINTRYKVGFISIHNDFYLPIAKFDPVAGAQKEKWYKKLFSVITGGGTPLRSALSTVGRIYAGKNPLNIANSDPVEYSCQPNFALLTTDGYWNTDSDADVKNVDGGQVGNQDADPAPKPKKEGTTATSNTLADVAKYYADTDLRSSTAFATNNCTGALGTNVCGEEAGNEANKEQTMTTLTLGLGIDGTKLYSSSYKTDTTGDFADIKSGSQNWSDPIANTDGERIDDLWHAAVNGNGTYFSASNPKQLTDSLRKALSDITSKVGAGSAAAASSLQPTAGDNYNYVASYATNKWIGNLEARKVDLTTFVTSPKAEWCVEDVAADTCDLPAKLVNESGTFSCKTTNSTAVACAALGGNFTGTDCRVAVATACVGKMSGQVTANNRAIKFNSGTSTAPVLTEFLFSNLNSTQKTYFNKTALAAKLSQWGDLTATVGGQQDVAAGVNIINYLRGNKNYEDSTSNPADDRLFREREATLGDITESQPAYIAQPKFKYTDSGYAAFSTAQANRVGTIYVGANDGMLHAFKASKTITDIDNGREIWAYIPTPILPKIAKLADRDYALNHINLANGDAVIGEVCMLGSGTLCANASGNDWKTVLVAGLNGGGRGFYAMDITVPTSPKLLWEFTSANAANLGYSFGAPIITKLDASTANGVNANKWVVLLTSGYNNGAYDNDGATANSPAGDGGGYLYVVDVATGQEIKKFPTGDGTSTTPSGLGQIAAFAQNALKNNLATYVYGGDLKGNLWRFDINAANGTAPLKLATLIGPTGLAQPITTTPQLGIVNKKIVVFVGTGKYLEITDLTNTDKQSLYAIKDVGGNSPLGSPRADTINFIPQTIAKATRKVVPEAAVDFSQVLGWRTDLPDDGERFNIDPLLVNGVLLAPTIVPSSTSCSPGGYGWFNFFNYKTGGAVAIAAGLVSEKSNAPVVGFNIMYDSAGNPVVGKTLADDPTGQLLDNKNIAKSTSGANRTTIFNKNSDNSYGTKSIWRELIK